MTEPSREDRRPSSNGVLPSWTSASSTETKALYCESHVNPVQPHNVLASVARASLGAPVCVHSGEVGGINGEIVGLSLDSLEVTAEGQRLLPEHCLTMTCGDRPRALAGDSCWAGVHGAQIDSGEADVEPLQVRLVDVP
eukprot:1873949-Rhodomonas_salina.1